MTDDDERARQCAIDNAFWLAAHTAIVLENTVVTSESTSLIFRVVETIALELNAHASTATRLRADRLLAETSAEARKRRAARARRSES